MRIFALGLAFAAFTAIAQDYPSKPIRMLVSFAPGGAVDTTARVLAQAMEQRLKWNFVIGAMVRSQNAAISSRPR